ncbi:MAG: RHS repeat-associated core domain-containing protein [Candidatus Altiarchaeota archaeon]
MKHKPHKLKPIVVVILILLLIPSISTAFSLNTVYYYANNELVGRKDPDGSTFYYHSDHLGGTHVVTDGDGNLDERSRYYPFGKIFREGSSRNLFTGQEFDTDTGLYYYGARYYNPEIRRFTQPDPIIQDYFNPQNLNRYSYTYNNPLKYTDPTGHNVYYVGSTASYGTYLGNLFGMSNKKIGGGKSISLGLIIGYSSSGKFSGGIYTRKGEGAITPSVSIGLEAGISENMENVEQFSGGTLDVGIGGGTGAYSLAAEESHPTKEEYDIDISTKIVQGTASIGLPIFPASAYILNSKTEVTEIKINLDLADISGDPRLKFIIHNKEPPDDNEGDNCKVGSCNKDQESTTGG